MLFLQVNLASHILLYNSQHCKSGSVYTQICTTLWKLSFYFFGLLKKGRIKVLRILQAWHQPGWWDDPNWKLATDPSWSRSLCIVDCLAQPHLATGCTAATVSGWGQVSWKSGKKSKYL